MVTYQFPDEILFVCLFWNSSKFQSYLQNRSEPNGDVEIYFYSIYEIGFDVHELTMRPPLTRHRFGSDVTGLRS